MDAHFTTSFISAKKLIVEAQKGYRGKFYYVFLTLFTLWFLFVSAVIWFEFGDPFMSILTLVIGIVIAVLPDAMIYYSANKNEKRLLLLFNDIPESTTSFYDSYLFDDDKTTGMELKIEYEKIKKIKQTKNLYLLILKQNLIVMVDKNRFEKDTCEEFEEFIKEKAVNAKIKL